MSLPEFEITTYYERYLPVHGTLVDVIATVRATRAEGTQTGPASAGRLAEVIMLDCSGSMGAPASKLFQARRAAIAAIDALPDGALFAVVAGTHVARMIYPEREGLVEMSPRRREAARQQLQRIGAGGGTSMSHWLSRSDRLLAGTAPGTVRHAILLTDGRNETETLTELEDVLARCAGRFMVDCRAISDRPGVDEWRSTELLRIADALGANPVVPVTELGRLTQEFTELIGVATSREVGDVRLRVRTSALTGVRFVKQVHPAAADLTGLAQPADDRCADFPIGAWGTGQRDYHIGLSVQPLTSGEERRVAWLSLLVPGGDGPADPGADAGGGSGGDGPAGGGQAGGVELGRASVDVEWTEDMARYTGINPTVAHYTRQQELAAAIRAAWEAFDEGRPTDAEALMGQAVALAHQAGAQDKLALFARVVEIDDAAAGLVRLRPDIEAGHWQVPTVTGHHTDAWTGQVQVPEPVVAPVPVQDCPRCGIRRRVRYCEQCGYDFLAPEPGPAGPGSGGPGSAGPGSAGPGAGEPGSGAGG